MRSIVSGVYLLDLKFSQAYLWDWGSGLTLIDCGVAGSTAAILDGIAALGRRVDQLREIVLTHAHDDHVGAAAELAERTGAQVLAHPGDAPVVRGERPQTPPHLENFERPLAESILPRVPRALAVRVDRELEDGQTTLGGGAIVAVPGHTPGSMAVHVPQSGLLFAGDALASHGGAPILGLFNVDRRSAIESVARLAALDFHVACFGHGDPLTGRADTRIRALAASLRGQT
jgi:glyoxylase-like metal-dependent hydrolase (beta-lactamase superfamily II)